MTDWFSRSPDHSRRPTRTNRRRPSLGRSGEYPREDDIEWLKQTHHITAVHNLQDSEDLRAIGLDLKALRKEYEEHGIHFHHTPIPDGSADAMSDHLKTALADLHSLIEKHERVYLHCNAGLNRAPTLAIAYLRAYHRMSLDEAMKHVKKRRACGPFMTVLEDYFGPRHLKPDK